MATWNELVHLLLGLKDNTEFAGPVAVESIEAVESALGVGFPVSYKKFLRTFGAGGISGFTPIPGSYSDDVSAMNYGTVLGDTMRCREMNGMTDRAVVVLRDYDTDAVWYLDLPNQRSERLEPAVWSFDIYKSRPDRKIAEDFINFVDEYFRGCLEGDSES